MMSRLNDGFGQHTADVSIHHPIDCFPVPHKLRNPADCHFASLDIGKIQMVSGELLLVPFVLAHPLVILDTFEYNLAEAIVISHVNKVRVEELGHHRSGFSVVVNLD